MKGTVKKDEQRGTWSYGFEYRDIEGKRHQPMRRGFATEKEASAALRDALRAHDTGAPMTEPSKESMAQYLERWLVHDAIKVGPTTYKRDRHHVAHDIVPVVGHLTVRALAPLHCEEVLNRAQRRGLAPRTINRIRSVLHKAMRQAVRWQIITVNPVAATDPRKTTKPRLVVPSAEGLAALQRASVGSRWEIAMLLATTIATRRGETLGLAWGHVDLDKGHVHIQRALQRVDGLLVFTELKTERSNRVVALPASARERLKAFKREQAEALLALGIRQGPETLIVTDPLGRPQDPSGFSKAAARFAREVGLPGARLHDNRHAVLTTMSASGVDTKSVSKVAGHTSEAFTLATYVHDTPGMVERAAEALEAALHPLPSRRRRRRRGGVNGG